MRRCEPIEIGERKAIVVYPGQRGLESPAAFIRREQPRHARHLLTQPQKPITEIADESVFISLAHFANVVKRLTGKTAREIRRGGRFWVR